MVMFKICLYIWCFLGVVSFAYVCEKGWRNRHEVTFNYSLYLFLLVVNIIFGAVSFFVTGVEICASNEKI